jgi:hypothetical protein
MALTAGWPTLANLVDLFHLVKWPSRMLATGTGWAKPSFWDES